MVGENTIDKMPLLPDRHPIGDFFICDVTDANWKDDLGSMEHPIFSLSTKPDTRPRSYEHNGVKITVAPSTYGLATIHDKDILIYCISQLIAKMEAGEAPSKTLYLKAYDLLIATNRRIDGRAYENLEAALDRLSGTRIKTNIKTNDETRREGFGLIDSWRVITRGDSDRMAQMQIVLSDWVLNAVIGKEVLTLHRNYFRLRGSLERRIYELARKHCGEQPHWKISLTLLQKKCASASTLKEFRRLVGKIVKRDLAHQHMPDYSIVLDEDDMVVFVNRNKAEPANTPKVTIGQLKLETYERARMAAPGLDIYQLEQAWRTSFDRPPRIPDEAFIGFCRKRYERQCFPVG